MIKIKSRTAKVYIMNNIVTKQFYATLPKNERHRLGPRNCVCGKPLKVLYNNEIELLKKLSKYEHFPKIISENPKDYSFSMTYCGKNLSSLRSKKGRKVKVPKDWKDQVIKINEALVKENIYNTDIALTNICILDNKIYLIDFGCCQPLDLKLKQNYDNRNNLIDLINKINEVL